MRAVVIPAALTPTLSRESGRGGPPTHVTFQLMKYRSNHDITPKNSAENTEPTTIVA